MKNHIKGFVKILEHYVWQVTFMYLMYFFFFKELQKAEKAQSSLEELWHFHPIMLHKCSILTLIIIFSLPEIFKKPPGL